MGTILSRIKEITEQEKVTIGYLEKQIGASKGVLSRAYRNNTDIQAKWLQLIVENYPIYSASWLLTGKGPMKTTGSSVAEQSSEYSVPSFPGVAQSSATVALPVNPTQNEQRVADLLKTIESLNQTVAVQKELITELRKR